ncbi:MAG: tetratricopeptide repeat protein [Victivallales bacterium]|nr:tetratricopeptide repeat protein [Victivallales bacterium]
MSNVLKNKKTVVFVLTAAAVAVRIVYLYQYSCSPLFNNIGGPDIGEYNTWANAIVDGNYLWDNVSIHSPLYPYFLALLKLITGNSFFYIRLFQLLLGIAGILYLFNIIYSFKGERERFTVTIAYAFLCLGYFFIPLIYYQGEIISESLLLPLICFSTGQLYKAEKTESLRGLKHYFMSGILLGLAVITHPIAVFYAFAELVYLFLKLLRYVKTKKTVASANIISFVFPVLIILSAVSIYNTYQSGSFVFIQRNSGYNLFLGNNPESNGMCYISAGPEWDRIHSKAEKAADEMGITKDKYFYRKVYRYITNNPYEWIKLVIRKALLVWNYKDIYSSLDPLKVKYYTPIMRYGRNFFGVLAVFALFGLYMTLRRKGRWIYSYRHFIILILSVWIGLSFTVVSDRYRYLMLPGLFVLAPCGLISLYINIKKAERVFIVLVYFVLAAVIVYMPLYRINTQKDNAFAAAMYGEAFYQEGKYADAEFNLQKALDVFPQWGRCYNNLGLIVMENNPEKAVKYLTKAYVIMPNNADPLMNLGLCFSSLGNDEKAESYFKKAFEIDKADPKTIFNYAYILYQEGKLEKAEKVLALSRKNNCVNSRIRNLNGVIYLTKGKPETALKYFKNAVYYSPDKNEYKLNLAACYIALKKPERAEGFISEVLKMDPGNKKAVYLRRMIDS